MKNIVITFIIASFVSCNLTSNKNVATYFGGQIVNPKDSFVLLLKDDKIIDSIFLNTENKFIKSFSNITEGLYAFKHGVEFQYVYLRPKDSILVRLNTWDFDESLVFSGNGSSKNEFLKNLFLQNESEEKEIYQYFKLNEQDFSHKIDSLIDVRKKLYEDFSKSESSTISTNFDELTNAAINLPLYRLKEIYPFFYKKAHNLDESPKLSDNFYNYRKNINFNNESLVAFYPYQNYIVSYLYNLSYQKTGHDKSKDELTINLLNAVSQNIKIEDFKNTLLKRIVINDFLKSESSCTIYEPTLQLFLDNCTNEDYKKQVNQLVEDSKLLKNNERLLDFEIESSDSKIHSINDIIKDRNAVIYFWTTEFTSAEYLVNRIKYLKNKFPEILFVGINIQSSFKEIKNEQNLKRFDIQHQYRLPKTSNAHTFLTSNYPRVIILNNKGIVQNGFTYLDSNKLHGELRKLEIN